MSHLQKFEMKHCGRGTVGRVVTIDTRHPRFETTH